MRVRLLFIACLLGTIAGCSDATGSSGTYGEQRVSTAETVTSRVPVPTGAAASKEAAPNRGTHCESSERTVYSCPFSKNAVVSVCEGNGELAYRYGPLGKPELQIVSDGGYGNLSFGWLRGQGNGHQKSLRFANGQYSYTVYSALAGDLTDTPGRKTSGLVVTKGTDAVLSGKLCPFKGSQQDSAKFGGSLIESLPEDADAAWM